GLLGSGLRILGRLLGGLVPGTLRGLVPGGLGRLVLGGLALRLGTLGGPPGLEGRLGGLGRRLLDLGRGGRLRCGVVHGGGGEREGVVGALVGLVGGRGLFAHRREPAFLAAWN